MRSEAHPRPDASLQLLMLMRPRLHQGKHADATQRNGGSPRAGCGCTQIVPQGAQTGAQRCRLSSTGLSADPPPSFWGLPVASTVPYGETPALRAAVSAALMASPNKAPADQTHGGLDPSAEVTSRVRVVQLYD